MATYYKNSSNGYSRLAVTITETSTDIASNTSVVRYELAIERVGGWSYNLDGGKLSCWVDGVLVVDTKKSFDLRKQSRQVLSTGTATVYHSNDGTGYCSISCSFASGVDGTMTVEGVGIYLTTIPRSSYIKSITGNTLGEAITVNFHKYSNSFRTRVWYKIYGSSWQDLGFTDENSITFTPPLRFASNIPESTSGHLLVSIETHYNGEKIGDDYYSDYQTVYLPDSIKPSFSSLKIVEDNTSVTNALGTGYFVETLSKLRGTCVSPEGSYGSTIVGVEIRVDKFKSVKTTTNGGLLGSLPKTGQGRFSVSGWVLDSRGRWSDSKVVWIDVLEYTPPVVYIDGKRSGSANTTLTILRNAKISPLAVKGTQKNSMNLTTSVKDINTGKVYPNTGGGGTWTTSSSLIDSWANLSNTWDKTHSFEITATLQDKFLTTSYKTVVGTEQVLMCKAPTGLGINKIWEKGALDVKGDIYVNGSKLPTTVPKEVEKSDHLHIWDNREVEQPPSWYWTNPRRRTKILEFKRVDKMKLDREIFSSSYFVLETLTPWSDKSGGNIIQKAIQSNSLGVVEAVRNSVSDTSWSNWKYVFKFDKTLSPTNNWRNASGYEPLRVVVSNGIAVITGCVESGDTGYGVNIAQLPTWAKPKYNIYSQVMTGNWSHGYVRVTTDGYIKVNNDIQSSWVCFDTICYPVQK